MGEYVDILDDKYTKTWKRIAIAKFLVKIGLYTLWIICLVALVGVLTPYVEGTMEYETLPLTMSQLESILTLVGICWMFSKAMKVI